MQFFEKNKALYQKDLTLKIGTKCDFRDWPGITFEAVVEAMFAQFDYNFQIMWVWYFLFVWYFHKKKSRWTSSPKTVHLKCMKTYE